MFAYIGTTHAKGYANKAAADWAGATWNAYISEITNAFAENPITLTTTATITSIPTPTLTRTTTPTNTQDVTKSSCCRYGSIRATTRSSTA